MIILGEVSTVSSCDISSQYHMTTVSAISYEYDIFILFSFTMFSQLNFGVNM